MLEMFYGLDTSGWVLGPERLRILEVNTGCNLIIRQYDDTGGCTTQMPELDSGVARVA